MVGVAIWKEKQFYYFMILLGAQYESGEGQCWENGGTTQQTHNLSYSLND